jgi:hypothetical protein
LKGITERPLLQLRKSRNLFTSLAALCFKTAPCQIKLAKAIKALDRRYVTDVTDQCLSVTVVAGPLQLELKFEARPIFRRKQLEATTLISLAGSLPSNHWHTEERIYL